ncbi:hypothetical protein COU37_02725 [Candidatus Micrarchaeota archaeon CG10_big_fil_rev_8_21_14_0_10_45_29]|nr:MAG: hypothetical protein COU37_02725 [Candidatus Micrarchaeota archaeon CG10_big_fil_rev_8_21_14_0_10_45_29]
MDIQKIISSVRETVASGYYERLAPERRERKSLCERIERMGVEGSLPVVAEIATAHSDGLFLPSRRAASKLIDAIGGRKDICALDLWVEPKLHAGDLRWLSKESEIPLISKDWIIDTRQIVGGDAVLLDISLLGIVNADLHEMIEVSHDLDLEAVVQIRTDEELVEAKRSEADVIMINNFGNNGMADVSVTLNALLKNKTGRPVISAFGVKAPAQVRSLLIAGANAIEMPASQVCSPFFEAELLKLRDAIHGKEPEKLEQQGKIAE